MKREKREASLFYLTAKHAKGAKLNCAFLSDLRVLRGENHATHGPTSASIEIPYASEFQNLMLAGWSLTFCQ